MKNLNAAIVTNVETNTDEGFKWIEFTIGTEAYSLQACCNEDGVVNQEDDGMNWGLCADANNEVFDLFGQEESVKFFYETI